MNKPRVEAEAANRLKDEFLATLSHELRTPLTAIIGWAHMLRAGHLDEGAAARALETIERQGKLQARLIDDLLDVSRIMTGNYRLDTQPVEIALTIEAVIDALRPTAEAKNIRLQKVLARPGLVLGDPGRLQQVVWNLLSNAIKFTPNEGSVQVWLEGIDSQLEITVSDTGAGGRALPDEPPGGLWRARIAVVVAHQNRSGGPSRFHRRFYVALWRTARR